MSDSKSRQEDQDREKIAPIRPATLFRATRFHAINKGVLVGFFDLTCPAWGVVINDCKLFRKGDREWVGLPAVGYKNRDGKMIWKNIVEIPDKDAQTRFQEAALRAIHQTLDQQG